MTDIVAELRARAQQGRFNLEAADEIERLRAELSEQCRLLGMSAEREAKHLAQIAALEKERDALRTELDALKAWKEEVEKQEPVGYWDPQDDMYFLPGFLLAESQAKMEPRYARPLPPAPSVPDGFSREDLEAVADGLDGYEKTVNVGNVTGEGDDHLESTTAYAARFIRTMLAAAPEAKL